jgi:hypothetical protein
MKQDHTSQYPTSASKNGSFDIFAFRDYCDWLQVGAQTSILLLPSLNALDG